MTDLTGICVFGGLGIFTLGIHGLRYMQARVVGGWNKIRIIRGLTGKYEILVRESNAPLWPLVVYRVCIPLGIALTFSSILWIK
jgi:hypothetical protein